jgi:DNA helicase-2/ATP-dependent DNA helicase PcrA
MQKSKEQIQILESKSNYLQVVAGAGSGKTTTMVELLIKILSEGKEKQEEILVITFTRKAKEELAERLRKKVGEVRILIHTFHSYCFYILKKYHPDFQNEETGIISPEESIQFWKDALKQEKFVIGGIPFELFQDSKNDLLQKLFPDISAKINLAYSQYKKDRKRLDFDDLVKFYLDGLRNQETWSLEAKKEVRRIIVDEYQDTDLEQLEWLQLLKPEFLTVVGDDWQAIYGFRGATTEPFLNFPKYFPGAEVLFLSTNYRSLPTIVKISEKPILKNQNNISKNVKSFRSGNAGVFKMYFSSTKEWNSLHPLFEPNLFEKYQPVILCRTNYRISQLQKLGFPQTNLLTIHKSKGLEFSTVILDLFEGWSKDENLEGVDLEEERRILYVGLSRAMNNLLLIGNKNKPKKSLEGLFWSYFRWNTKEINTTKLFNKNLLYTTNST